MVRPGIDPPRRVGPDRDVGLSYWPIRRSRSRTGQVRSEQHWNRAHRPAIGHCMGGKVKTIVRRKRMKRISRFIVAGMLSVVVLAGSTVAFAASYKYTVTLKPTNIKNSQGTPITVGSGTATIT